MNVRVHAIQIVRAYLPFWRTGTPPNYLVWRTEKHKNSPTCCISVKFFFWWGHKPANCSKNRIEQEKPGSNRADAKPGIGRGYWIIRKWRYILPWPRMESEWNHPFDGHISGAAGAIFASSDGKKRPPHRYRHWGRKRSYRESIWR